jgi:hypothetical protein
MIRSTRRVLASVVRPALRTALGTPLAGAILAACSSGSAPIGQMPVVGMTPAIIPDAAVRTEPPVPRPGIPSDVAPVAPGTVAPPDPPRPGIIRPQPAPPPGTTSPGHSELRPTRGSRRAVADAVDAAGSTARTGFAGGGPRRLS